MISYDAMVTEVTSRLGGRSDIAARIGRWINYAYLELLMQPRFSFFELDKTSDNAILAATPSFDLSTIADFWFLLHLADTTNSRRLERSHIKVLDDLITTTGQVQRFARFGPIAYFDPIPDANFTLRVRYRRRATPLVSGTAFDDLGDEWEEPLVTLSVVKGWEALDQRDKASEQRQLLEPMLAAREDVPGLEFMADTEITIEPVTEWRGG